MSRRLALFIAVLATVYTGTNTQSPSCPSGNCIANAYNSTQYGQAGRMIQAPGQPRLCQVFYTNQNISIIECYANYGFNDSSSGWAQGKSFVPDSIVFGLPFCALSDAQIVSATPPECTGQLLYGFTEIGQVGNQSTDINGNTDQFIIGISVPNLDLGYPFFSKGSVTWLRPPGCASNNPTFKIQFGVGVLGDVVDWAPIHVTDSYSGGSLDAAAIGIACGNTGGRSPTAARLNPQPSFIPICRGYMHCADQANFSICEQQMNNVTSPGNVFVNSDVYQLRIDGLGPGLLVDTQVTFFYADNNHTSLEFFAGYDDIYYFESRGDLPAAVYACYYTSDCALLPAWNEVLLGYLPPCDCTVPVNNILCNASSDMIGGPVARSDVPNFNVLLPAVPVPFCGFAINPSNNGTFVVEDRTFALQSLSSGGVGTLFYSWQLANLPPSGGVIFSPNNAQTVTAIVYAAMQLTVVHTVWNLNGPAQTCNQTIQVVGIAPTACITPSSINGLLVGAPTVTLDGACSSSPDMVALTYNWTILAAPYPYTGGVITLPTSVATGFRCSVPGRYVVGLVVNNTVQVGSAIASILCVPQPPPEPPGAGPVAQPLPPIECVVPLPPTVVPPTTVIPAQPPLAPTPLPPSYLPAPPGTAPDVAPGSLPPDVISDSSITGVLIVFGFVFLTCFGFTVYKGRTLFSGGGGGGGKKQATELPTNNKPPPQQGGGGGGDITVRYDKTGRMIIDNTTGAPIKYRG